jgi:hypothetical protein
MLVIQTDDGLVPWNGEPINGTSHPRNIEQLWSDEELAAVGLCRVEDQPVPADKVARDWTLEKTPEGVENVPVLEDKPPPVPSLEDRVTVIEKKLGL